MSFYIYLFKAEVSSLGKSIAFANKQPLDQLGEDDKILAF